MSRRRPNHDRIYATPAQEHYLRRLIQQAAPLRCAPYRFDQSRRLLRSDASKAIDDFKAAIEAATARAEEDRRNAAAQEARRHG